MRRVNKQVQYSAVWPSDNYGKDRSYEKHHKNTEANTVPVAMKEHIVECNQPDLVT